MVMANVRDLLHHFSKYLKKIKKGERISIVRHGKPVADLVPHNENVEQPAWKRKIKRIRLKKGISASQAVIRNREEEER